MATPNPHFKSLLPANDLPRMSLGQPESLQDDGGDGTFSDMSKVDGIDNRLHRLEGGNDLLKWTIGIVSSVLIGGMAIVVAFQLYLAGQVSALPDQINSNLLDLNRTISASITAARSGEAAPAPIVIFPPGTPAISNQTSPKQ